MTEAMGNCQFEAFANEMERLGIGTPDERQPASLRVISCGVIVGRWSEFKPIFAAEKLTLKRVKEMGTRESKEWNHIGSDVALQVLAKHFAVAVQVLDVRADIWHMLFMHEDTAKSAISRNVSVPVVFVLKVGNHYMGCAPPMHTSPSSETPPSTFLLQQFRYVRSVPHSIQGQFEKNGVGIVHSNTDVDENNK